VGGGVVTVFKGGEWREGLSTGDLSSLGASRWNFSPTTVISIWMKADSLGF